MYLIIYPLINMYLIIYLLISSSFLSCFFLFTFDELPGSLNLFHHQFTGTFKRLLEHACLKACLHFPCTCRPTCHTLHGKCKQAVRMKYVYMPKALCIQLASKWGMQIFNPLQAQHKQWLRDLHSSVFAWTQPGVSRRSTTTTAKQTKKRSISISTDFI